MLGYIESLSLKPACPTKTLSQQKARKKQLRKREGGKEGERLPIRYLSSQVFREITEDIVHPFIPILPQAMHPSIPSHPLSKGSSEPVGWVCHTWEVQSSSSEEGFEGRLREEHLRAGLYQKQ